MIFTTSWDDGDALDTRTSELLSKYGATGTFYVCPKTCGLSEQEIRELHERHEVGAHTMTHPKLTQISPESSQKEISDSKKWVENILQKPCVSFCYPFGDENASVRAMAKAAGFTSARTVELNRFESGDLYGMPTSVQVYPFPFRRRYKKLTHFFDPLDRLMFMRHGLSTMSLPLSAYTSWLRLAKAMFAYALKNNRPYFHVWGHSWELEQYGMWKDFEAFLTFVKDHSDKVQMATNAGLAMRVGD